MPLSALCRESALRLAVVEPHADAAAVDDVVLLHGWGSDRRIWSRLVPELRHRCRLHLLDLPGFGVNVDAGGDWEDEAALLQSIAAVLPPRAHWVGWSLGGNLALALARAHPERLLSLTLIATNPCFVAREGWPWAMEADTFRRFARQLGAQPDQTIRRFQQLQCHGDRQGRGLVQRLRDLLGGALAYDGGALAAALAYLGRVDQRAWRDAGDPLYLFGEADALVPVDVAARVGRSAVLPGSAHVPMLTDPVGLGARLLAEMRRHPEREAQRRKRRIADSFSEAAGSYDSVAGLQRAVGARLLDHCPVAGDPGLGLDLGCGTGHFLGRLQQARPALHWLGGDLAEGMLRHIRRRAGLAGLPLLGLDAEALPLADGSLAGIYSNLAVQWCRDLDGLFFELHRVLRPGGWLAVSTLLDGTLGELKSAWRQVDSRVHVNRFYARRQWLAAAERAGFTPLVVQGEHRATHYEQLGELMHELKALGAHNLNEGRPQGLTGKGRWRALRAAYEVHRVAGRGLPASWELLYGVFTRA